MSDVMQSSAKAQADQTKRALEQLVAIHMPETAAASGLGSTVDATAWIKEMSDRFPLLVRPASLGIHILTKWLEDQGVHAGHSFIAALRKEWMKDAMRHAADVEHAMKKLAKMDARCPHCSEKVPAATLDAKSGLCLDCHPKCVKCGNPAEVDQGFGDICWSCIESETSGKSKAATTYPTFSCPICHGNATLVDGPEGKPEFLCHDCPIPFELVPLNSEPFEDYDDGNRFDDWRQEQTIDNC